MLLLVGNTVARAAAPGPETGPVKLTIRPSDSNNVTVERRGDDYVITTTGVDPYVFLDAERPVDVDEYPMLAFNSFNTSGIMSLALFVGQLDNAHLIEGNLYELPRTEGWSSNAYDISCTDTPPAGPVSWIRIRFGMNGGNKEAAKKVGELIAKRAAEKGITEVVFDRGGYVYHGRVKELAEGAREGGLKF